MKKTVSALLIATLILGMLTGCGSNDQHKTQTSDQPQAVDQAESADEDSSATPADEDEDYSQYLPTGSVDFMNCTIKDLDLNDVALSDYIKGNKVTMLNIWGTFCGPCINEMPDLGELERKYKDQGFEIVGLTSDVTDRDGNYDEEVIADAKDIIDKTGITYPVLVCTLDFLTDLGIQAVPTTFFVDSEGNVLGEAMPGSNTAEDWEKIIKDYLGEG